MKRAVFSILFFPVILLFAPDEARSQAKQHARPKVGLVLSGGGAKGLAHVGVLKVLEKAGVRVDYITGTSMGSIVGGFYSIGYDAKSLEKLSLEQPWFDLLNDEIPLRNIPIEEKSDESKYVLSFALKGFGFELPKGLIKGQKLLTRLAALTLPYHQTDDFNKLPIPFRCVATDIESGEAVVFKKGFLPLALRASMSIPSALTPVEIDGRLLVDGGVVRNFPVDDVREMGADFVIGVDVGAPLYKKEEIDSLAQILEQSISFLNDISTKKQRNLCNILILPDIRGIGVMDFDRAEDIIKRGEDAALSVYPQLVKLGEKLKKYPDYDRPVAPPPQAFKQYWVSDMRVQGLKRVSKGLVMSKLAIDLPSTISSEELEESIQDLYGSNFFEQIRFRLVPTDVGNVLLLDAEEKSTNLLRFGISYDTSLKSAIFVNLTLRNLLGMGSFFSVSGRLSEYPGFDASYFIYTGLRPGIGLGLDAQINMYNVLSYPNPNRGSDIPSSYGLTIYHGRVYLQTIYSTVFALRIGIEKEYNKLSPDLGSSYIVNTDTESLNYFAYLKLDTLDRYYYPRSGLQFNLEAAIITDEIPVRDKDNYADFKKFTAEFLAVIPFHRYVSFMLSARGGAILGNNIPYGYLLYMGGLYTFSRDSFSFPGMHFLEMSGRNAIVFQTGLQLEPWKNIIILPRGAAGRTEDRFRELFSDFKYIYTCGMTLAYNSLIGPVEVTGMYNLKSKQFIAYFNIGFRY